MNDNYRKTPIAGSSRCLFSAGGVVPVMMNPPIKRMDQVLAS